MYTGTLISELMLAAERVGLVAAEIHMAEELHEIFTMQVPVKDSDQIYMGAA